MSAAQPSVSQPTGGCQCGRIRYRVTGGLGRAGLCHCRMCQRASGNVFAPLVTAHGVEWEGTPARFASSDVADRGFCPHCGTPLFYDGRAGQGMNLMVGTLDDPDQAVPELHYGVESRVSWLHLSDGWPEYETRPGGLTGKGPPSIASLQSPVRESK
jgi:hypothetical protein